MTNKYIILRSSRAVTRDPFTGTTFSRRNMESTYPDLQLEVDEMSRSKVVDLSGRSDVVAIAPAIPMKLIAPVDLGNSAKVPKSKVAWGVKAVGADDSPFSGDGIVVAVLDTGIDASHPAFSGVELIQQDFSGEGDGDTIGHGTHCAGTIFGQAVEDMRIGVATGVKRALIGKVLGEEGGSTEQICQGILWAVDHGANVISMSLGMDFPGYVKSLEEQGLPTELATSRALEDYRINTQLFAELAAMIKARAAFAQPTVIVAAAGNESRRDDNPDWEISVSPPAVVEGIISVAALGQGTGGLSVAPFSNTGANIAGPGVKVVSAKAGGGLVALSGTSMATPHLAGLVALWAEKLQKMGRLNTLDLISRVVASGTYKGLKKGIDPFDVGAGLACAPKD
jgi:subtilisin family serine protease